MDVAIFLAAKPSLWRGPKTAADQPCGMGREADNFSLASAWEDNEHKQAELEQKSPACLEKLQKTLCSSKFSESKTEALRMFQCFKNDGRLSSFQDCSLACALSNTISHLPSSLCEWPKPANLWSLELPLLHRPIHSMSAVANREGNAPPSNGNNDFLFPSRCFELYRWKSCTGSKFPF